jgi:hypothetical protein
MDLNPVEMLMLEHDLSTNDATALARFTTPNFAVKDRRQDPVEELRKTFFDAALATINASAPTKSRAVALTELETAMMWAVKAFFGAPGE